MKTSFFKDFINQYSLSKTLRFELQPQGKTEEFIEKNGHLRTDNVRAEKYKKAKKIIDKYHKDFINKSLAGLILQGLRDYADLYLMKNKEDKDRLTFAKIKEALRKQIADTFKKHENFKDLFTKKVFEENPTNFISQEEKECIREFKNFTTYFSGFHENRKNMYVAEKKSTAIAHRLIHNNLPRFIDNIKTFEKIKNNAPEFIKKLNQVLIEMEDIAQGKTLEEIFSLEYFNEILTQTGIDLYNILIGGRTIKDGKTKIKGLNEYINTDYNQKQKDKKRRLPKFVKLYKQILGDKYSASFIPESFKSDDEVLESIEKFYTNELLNCVIDGEDINVFEKIKSVMSDIGSFDLSEIYITNKHMSDISQKIFSDWSTINSALGNYYEKTFPIKPKAKREKYEEKKNRWVKQDKSIQTLQTAIDQYDNEMVIGKNSGRIIIDHFVAFGLNGNNEIDMLQKINHNYAIVKDLLNTPYVENKKLANNEMCIKMIKDFLDSIMDVKYFIRPLYLKGDDKEKDEFFYSLFNPLFEQLNNITHLYDQVRNYITQKPYSKEKIKLNFDNPTLMSGWDLNKEMESTAVILCKDNLYYLGITEKKNNHIFQNTPELIGEEPFFKKMVYKYFPDVSKMIPKCSTQLNEVSSHFKSSDKDIFVGNDNFDGVLKISKRIFDLNNYAYDISTGTMILSQDDKRNPKMFQKEYLKISKDADGFKKALKDWIDFCVDFLKKYKGVKHYSLSFNKSESYNSLDEFYRDINEQTYKITYKNIPASYIEGLVNEGELYLFKIYNKDFSQHSKGKPNLHTLYWKMLFDEANLKNTVYKLDGKAEIFYRKLSITKENKIVHKANEILVNKNPDNEKKTSKFNYDITKDKRYTENKYQLSVSITANFKAAGTSSINQKANEFLKQNSKINILALDLGERNLLYYTLMNQQSQILKQGSLNVITSGKQKVDYHNLLGKKKDARAQARNEWGAIEGIKDVKMGYLSQVIPEITKLMIDNNAVVVMEDLTVKFMRSRQGVEKEIYQNFEKKLIDKLSFLVDKNKLANEDGGLLKAFQLASKFESFEKMQKQSGLIFYVPAWHTSKIDPATGFVDLLKPKYENIKQTKDFFGKFNSIRFNVKERYFEFAFDYNNFTIKAESSKTVWAVCTTNKNRYLWNKTLNNGRGAQELYKITEKMQELFGENSIDYSAGQELKNQIISSNSADFFKTLTKLLSITLSLRYNNGEKGEKEKDYILSPVANNDGIFFDSEEADDTMPKNADANGAFHIALKGLWCLQQIDKSSDLKNINLSISNKEWLHFAQTLSKRRCNRSHDSVRVPVKCNA